MSRIVESLILSAGMTMRRKTMIVTSLIGATTIVMIVIDVVVVVVAAMKTMMMMKRPTTLTRTPRVTTQDLVRRLPTKGRRARGDHLRQTGDMRGDRCQSEESEGNTRRYRRWFRHLSRVPTLGSLLTRYHTCLLLRH